MGKSDRRKINHSKLIKIILNKLSTLTLKNLLRLRRQISSFKKMNSSILTLQPLIEYLYGDVLNDLLERYNTIKSITLHKVDLADNIRFFKMFVYQKNINVINAIPLWLHTYYKDNGSAIDLNNTLLIESINTTKGNRVIDVSPLYDMGRFVNACTIEFIDGVRVIGAIRHRPFQDLVVTIGHPTHSLIDKMIGNQYDPVYLSSDGSITVSLNNILFPNMMLDDAFISANGNENNTILSVPNIKDPRGYRYVYNTIVSSIYWRNDLSIRSIMTNYSKNMFNCITKPFAYNSVSLHSYINIDTNNVIVYMPIGKSDDDEEYVEVKYPVLVEDTHTKTDTQSIISNLFYGPNNQVFKTYGDFMAVYTENLDRYLDALSNIKDSFDRVYGQIKYTGDMKDLLTEIQYYHNDVSDSRYDWIDVLDRRR